MFLCDIKFSYQQIMVRHVLLPFWDIDQTRWRPVYCNHKTASRYTTSLGQSTTGAASDGKSSLLNVAFEVSGSLYHSFSSRVRKQASAPKDTENSKWVQHRFQIFKYSLLSIRISAIQFWHVLNNSAKPFDCIDEEHRYYEMQRAAYLTQKHPCSPHRHTETQADLGNRFQQ
jgi:hypothetical protein